MGLSDFIKTGTWLCAIWGKIGKIWTQYRQKLGEKWDRWELSDFKNVQNKWEKQSPIWIDMEKKIVRSHKNWKEIVSDKKKILCGLWKIRVGKIRVGTVWNSELDQWNARKFGHWRNRKFDDLESQECGSWGIEYFKTWGILQIKKLPIRMDGTGIVPVSWINPPDRGTELHGRGMGKKTCWLGQFCITYFVNGKIRATFLMQQWLMLICWSVTRPYACVAVVP